MSSEVSIINMGLTLIGANVITSRDDDNDRARVADLFYDDTRDAVLRAHPWGFAKYRAALAEAAGSPSFGWDYHFTLPTTPKCLRVLEVDEDYPGQIPYSVEGRKLLCDEESVSILYIAQITDTGNFDALFTDCLAARLAAVFAMALSKQKTLVDLAWAVYKEKMPEAKTVDGIESVRRSVHNTTFTSVR
jgi:hypothetical protein